VEKHSLLSIVWSEPSSYSITKSCSAKTVSWALGRAGGEGERRMYSSLLTGSGGAVRLELDGGEVAVGPCWLARDDGKGEGEGGEEGEERGGESKLHVDERGSEAGGEM
jgi:hypothetical protein